MALAGCCCSSDLCQQCGAGCSLVQQRAGKSCFFAGAADGGCYPLPNACPAAPTCTALPLLHTPRWPYLRARIHPLLFFVFNATFVAVIQHLVLLGLTTPAYLAWQVRRGLQQLFAWLGVLVAPRHPCSVRNSRSTK